eukprot:383344-Hanusia_phi.AAC.1
MMQSVRLLALVLFLIQPNVVDTFTESASSPAARSTGGNFRSAKTSFFPLLRSKISSAAELRYGLATALPQGSASTKAGNPEQSVSHLFNSKLVVDNNSFLSKVWHARHHLVAGAIVSLLPAPPCMLIVRCRDDAWLSLSCSLSIPSRPGCSSMGPSAALQPSGRR